MQGNLHSHIFINVQDMRFSYYTLKRDKLFEIIFINLFKLKYGFLYYIYYILKEY